MDTDKINPFYFSSNENKVVEEKLLEPFTYILQDSVKAKEDKIKMELVEAFNYWLKASNNKIQSIIDLMNMIYNNNILLNDIQDNSTLRRGVPVAHSIYGIGNTANVLSYIIMIGMEKAINIHPAAPQIYVEELLEILRGQAMDVFWRQNIICPTEAEYKTMTLKKIGGLLNLALKLMKLFSSYKEDFSSLIGILSLYLQVREDYCNLCLDHRVDKNYYENVTDSKFNIAVIHALTIHPNDNQIMSILKQQTRDIEMKHYYIEVLKKYGSLKYMKCLLNELDVAARVEIKRLGDNPLLIKILNELKDWDNKEALKNL